MNVSNATMTTVGMITLVASLALGVAVGAQPGTGTGTATPDLRALVFAPGCQAVDGAWRTAAEGDVTGFVLVALSLTPEVEGGRRPAPRAPQPRAVRFPRPAADRLRAVIRARRHLLRSIHLHGTIGFDPLQEALAALALLEAGEKNAALRLAAPWIRGASAERRPVRWRRTATEFVRTLVAERAAGRGDRSSLCDVLANVSWGDAFTAKVAACLPRTRATNKNDKTRTVRVERIRLPAFWCVADGALPIVAFGRIPKGATAKLLLETREQAIRARFEVSGATATDERIDVVERGAVVLGPGKYRGDGGATTRVFGQKFLVQLERIGGFAGFDDRLELYADGTLREWSRGRTQSRRVASGRLASITKLLDGVRKLDGVGTVKVDGVVRNVTAPGKGSTEVSADLMTLRVVYRERKGAFVRLIADDRSTPPKVWIDLVNALSALF